MGTVSIDLANNLASIIVSILSVIAVAIGFVAWFIRLESKVTYLEKDHIQHKAEVARRDEATIVKQDTMQVTLNKVLQIIGELKGRIDK